jgi:uncharacterized caspase-like protein
MSSRKLGLLIIYALLKTLIFCQNETTPRYALVIGNSSYESLPSLANPERDAKAMAQALNNLGFNVVALYNISRKEMNQAIITFREDLSQNALSEGIFFYAGHGVQSSKGENYLLPSDGKIKAESDLEDEAVRTQKILDSLNEARNRVNLVILDACRDNPLPSSVRSSGFRGLAAATVAPPETIVLYSTAAGQTASDGIPGSQNSPFVVAFLKYISEPGDITRTIKLIIGEVKSSTPEQQTPYVYSNLSKDFNLNRGDKPFNASWNIDSPIIATQYKKVEKKGALADRLFVSLGGGFWNISDYIYYRYQANIGYTIGNSISGGLGYSMILNGFTLIGVTFDPFIMFNISYYSGQKAA